MGAATGTCSKCATLPMHVCRLARMHFLSVLCACRIRCYTHHQMLAFLHDAFMPSSSLFDDSLNAQRCVPGRAGQGPGFFFRVVPACVWTVYGVARWHWVVRKKKEQPEKKILRVWPIGCA